MSLLTFRRAKPAPQTGGDFIARASIEVMPRTAAKVDSFKALLPAGTRVYIAHIDGTPIEEMVATAARIAGEGFTVMPHFPARSIESRAQLSDWIARYQGEAGVTEALVLAGGIGSPRGAFHSSMQLLETGEFDRAGFTRLHVAGHPEGNRDIDPDGGDAVVRDALRWKQDFANRSNARMALVTQFVFDAEPVIGWARTIREAGIDLPVHVGLAGPAKLQTLIKYAMACGVGPSLKVLQKRAMDVSKLLVPYAPDEIAAELERARLAEPELGLEQAHLFPLGGIAASAEWLAARQPAQASVAR
ncbi:methylenetetrahydrofolate reductase [Limimaricola soesokkakensis]|uniref:methylenetetrahydrofolate reductase n=1 Tax=Limimaricola soesokkakensis TaxID=1343159 RepID=UPI0035179B60